MLRSGKGRRKHALLAVTVASALVVSTSSPGSAADQPAMVTYHDSFTTQLPGMSTGRTFRDELSNPSDPNGKPPATTHVHTELPAGARYDTAAVPACAANDAQIMAVGPTACPAASSVGT